MPVHSLWGKTQGVLYWFSTVCHFNSIHVHIYTAGLTAPFNPAGRDHCLGFVLSFKTRPWILVERTRTLSWPACAHHLPRRIRPTGEFALAFFICCAEEEREASKDSLQEGIGENSLLYLAVRLPVSADLWWVLDKSDVKAGGMQEQTREMWKLRLQVKTSDVKQTQTHFFFWQIFFVFDFWSLWLLKIHPKM